MTWRIDDDVFALCGAKENLGSIDGDSLLLLFLQRIEQKGEFEFLALLLADIADKIELAIGQTSSVGEETSDQCGFSMIHMTDDDQPQKATGKIWCATVITHLHISPGAKFLHGIGVFLILCPTGAL